MYVKTSKKNEMVFSIVIRPPSRSGMFSTLTGMDIQTKF